MPTQSPLGVLGTETIVFTVPKQIKSPSGVGFSSYAPNEVESLTYDFYLKGAYSNTFEFVSLEGSSLPLIGYCVKPLSLDSRIIPGTIATGYFKGILGEYKLQAGDKGIPQVRGVIGDKVAFIFSSLSIHNSRI